MLDIGSQEKEAHHQFMSFNPDQLKGVNNLEVFGNAAAYHAAVAYTDHCEKVGAPGNIKDGQALVLGYAKDFVNTQVDSKGLKLDKGEALKFAAQTLSPKITSGEPGTWQVPHNTPVKSFDARTSTAKESRNFDIWNLEFGSGGTNIG